MAKAALYMAGTATRDVAAGEAIPLGRVIRKFGCCITGNMDDITLTEMGYYQLNASFTVVPDTTGSIVVRAYDVATAIPGAEATATVWTTDVPVTITIPYIVRATRCCDPMTITFVIEGGDAAVTSSAVSVIKL